MSKEAGRYVHNIQVLVCVERLYSNDSVSVCEARSLDLTVHLPRVTLSLVQWFTALCSLSTVHCLLSRCASVMPQGAVASDAARAAGTLVSVNFGEDLQVGCTAPMTLAQLRAECTKVRSDG